MTAATTRGAAVRLGAPAPLNWEKIGVILAVLAQLGGAVWFAASVDRRVSTLEAQLPPGIVQRLDERTAQMQASLGRLEAAR